MNVNKLLIVLLSQFSLISALDLAEPAVTMSSVGDSSTVLESKNHNNGSVAQMLQDSVKASESEDQQEMGWRAQHPDLNTGISFSAGAAVGGTIGFMLGLAVAGMFYSSIEI